MRLYCQLSRSDRDRARPRPRSLTIMENEIGIMINFLKNPYLHCVLLSVVVLIT